MKFLIYRNPKSAMQSGKKNTKKWLMTLLEENNSRSISSPLSWVGSNDTKTQLQFNFSSKDQAEEFAKSQGYEYEIRDSFNPIIKPKSYANNFL
jgi:hypothetical protein